MEVNQEITGAQMGDPEVCTPRFAGFAVMSNERAWSVGWLCASRNGFL